MATTEAGILTRKGLEDMFVPILRNCKNMATMKKIHSQVVKFSLTQSNFLVVKMIDFCNKIGDIEYARLLFKQVEEPNTFLFNSMIRAYTYKKMYVSCIHAYTQMLMRRQTTKSEESIFPDAYTYPFVIRSCGGFTHAHTGKQLHGHVFELGLESNHVIQNSLLDMYVKCGGEYNINDAQKLFDEMTVRDVISWNSLISGYIKLGKVKRAKALFEEMPEKSIVSWTAMISGYTKTGRYGDALDVFRRMQMVGGLEPDWVSLVAVLPSCAYLGALEVGEWIHFYAAKKGFLKNTCVCNALMEMYAKCGNVDRALEVFDRMKSSSRDVISWSTMIVGLANHGRAHEAIELFKQMDVTPNEITFVGLLSACGHAGLVDEGLGYFDSMRDDHNITPEIEHYGCLVDLLARTGNQKRALEIINRMPMKADSAIWGSVLSSCRSARDVETAVVAAEHLVELEPDDSGNYVLLANVYADMGKWDCVSTTRRLMRRKTMKKTPGCSLIEVNGLVQEFVSGDDSKPFVKDIYHVLHQLLILHGDDNDDGVYAFL
ncbi:unnamed protein product [Cuscuta campestris]|uniref:Pentacotripeptide-repeat region of PRORP domain-containing protein n=2 Tax=Cuscuta sect. Cleistogrammica TaxID=1824901 RepID=A0A484K6G1_9ASTE|nr:hypothetical protein DM860_003545 [Cuscuta australis]VFQ58877.1 unnamed protein product [Cuscuta campestris]